MREIPILFSTSMVQAIQEDRKNKTRRLNNLQEINLKPDDWIFQGWVNDSKQLKAFFENKNMPLIQSAKCPWQPGDILWVRETWWRNYPHEYGRYFYRADGEEIEVPAVTGGTVARGKADGLKWNPSIFMPKDAARIFLEVTDVRVERLQDIAYDDCLCEGMWDYGTDVDTLAAFQELWQNLNEKRGYSWDTNPWVWVVEFRRVEKC